MAVQISNGTSVPHATSYADLLSKLITFVTANGWVVMADETPQTDYRRVYLKGTGTTGTDAIHVGIYQYADPNNSNYGWYLNGYTGFVNGNSWETQPGSCPNPYQALPLWLNEIPYWFIVSARRIIVIAKVGTTYQMCYLGYFLPFAMPNQYPYPLCIGSAAMGAQLYSGTTKYNSNFLWGFLATATERVLSVRLPDGSWKSIGFVPSLYNRSNGVYPYASYWYNGTQERGASNSFLNIRESLDGSYPLYPCTILLAPNDDSQTHNILGEFDGVKFVPGFGQAAENTITIGAQTYLVVPNVFRGGYLDFCAVELA